MRFLECLHHLLHFLTTQQFRGAGFQRFEQMRRDHRGGFDDDIAQCFRFRATRSGNPARRHAKRRVDGLHAIDFRDHTAGIERHHETRKHFGAGNFRAAQLDHVFVGRQSDVVADANGRYQDAQFDCGLLAQQ